MKKSAIVAAVAAAATAFVAHAQTKPEDHIKQRRSAYAVIGYNFSNLAAMAQGKKPYDREQAVRNAELVAALADYPHGHFVEGTDRGETKAKSGIWKDRADFDRKMEKMIQEARKLPQAAKDHGELKGQVAETGKACKACHDEYRAK